jgi:hTAFII28-like protein conserved region
VGELTEGALEVMEEWGETGPILPSHIREAMRRYRAAKNRIPNKMYRRQLFM